MTTSRSPTVTSFLLLLLPISALDLFRSLFRYSLCHNLLLLLLGPHWPRVARVLQGLAHRHQVDVGKGVHVLDQPLVGGPVAIADEEPRRMDEHAERSPTAQIVALEVALHPLEHGLLVVLWPVKLKFQLSVRVGEHKTRDYHLQILARVHHRALVALQVVPAEDGRDPDVGQRRDGTIAEGTVLDRGVVQRVRPHSGVRKVLRRHGAVVVEARPLDHLERIVAGQLEQGHADTADVVPVDLGKVGNQITFVVELLHQQIHGGRLPVVHSRVVAAQGRGQKGVEKCN